MLTKFLGMTLFLSSLCFASGRLSLEGDYYLNGQEALPKAGISIHENLGFLGLHYGQWTGVGMAPKTGSTPDVLWATSRHDLEWYYGQWGVAAGFTYRHATQPGVDLLADHDVHVKLMYTLW